LVTAVTILKQEHYPYTSYRLALLVLKRKFSTLFRCKGHNFNICIYFKKKNRKTL